MFQDEEAEADMQQVEAELPKSDQIVSAAKEKVFYNFII